MESATCTKYLCSQVLMSGKVGTSSSSVLVRVLIPKLVQALEALWHVN